MRYHAFGVQIIAPAHFAVEIRRGIARAPVDQVQFGIVAAGQPGVASGSLPGVPRPSLVSRFTGLRNHIPAPTPLTRNSIVGIQPAVKPVIAGRDSDDDFVLHHHRSDGAPVALGGLCQFDCPQPVARSGIERHEVSVGRTEVDAVAIQGYTPVWPPLHGRFKTIFPNPASGACIERIYLVRLRDVHHAIRDQRDRLQAGGARHMKYPLRDQRPHVASVNLPQRRVALRVICAGVTQPVGRIGAQEVLRGDLCFRAEYDGNCRHQ